MKVRDATFDDLGTLQTIGLVAHQQSPIAEFKPDLALAQRTYVLMIHGVDGYAKVLEHDGVIVGGCIGMVTTNPYGIRCGQDLFTYSARGTHLLLKDFYKWAKGRGAEFVQITDQCGNERYHRLIEKLGFKPGNSNFIGV